MSKILITGATGTNGKALIKKLNELNASYVIATRNPEEAAKNFSDAAIVAFAFDKPETFENAVAGVDKVFLLGPPLVLKLDELILPFIKFLKEKKIKRVVYLSALAADKMGESLDFHPKVEQILKDNDFEYTILRPSFFAQNFKNYELENITQRGITFMTAGTGKVAFVDIDDVANVAATALTQEGHAKKIYELTGPQTLSYFDAATLLSEVTGKTIVYPNPTHEEFRQALTGAGAPAFVADYMITVYNSIANNHVDFTTDTVEKVTGKKPISLREVLEKDFQNI